VKPKSDLLQSVQRACRLLTLIALERRAMTPREISSALGLNLSTTYHLLNTLESEELLHRDPGGSWRLGHRVSDLSDAFRAMLRPAEWMIELVDELNRRTGETSYLGIWQGDEVVSVVVREGRGGVQVRGVHLGYSKHAYARALGRALLAFCDDDFIEGYLATVDFEPLTHFTATDPRVLHERLAETRRRGYAMECEEFTLGACCVGAPVISGDRAVAAVSVSVPKARFDVESAMLIDTVLDVAREGGERLSAARSHVEGADGTPSHASSRREQARARARS
jgi:DNA-binding IclR family transcriptional regulator